MNKEKHIETIKKLLIKARPTSGGTLAERQACKNKAFVLMEKHAITREDLIPQPKQREQKKSTRAPQSNRGFYEFSYADYDFLENKSYTNKVLNVISGAFPKHRLVVLSYTKRILGDYDALVATVQYLDDMNRKYLDEKEKQAKKSIFTKIKEYFGNK